MDEQDQNRQPQQQEPLTAPQSSPQQTPEGNQNSGGSLSFDELLKQHPEYQSEFDRRMTKGVATARSKWEQEQAESVAFQTAPVLQPFVLLHSRYSLKLRDIEHIA